jgi:sugar/nucleoside kinase (ribokinase family)
MFDICCIGHITQDRVVTPQSVKYMPGGTAYYFSCALANLDINYKLVTAVGDAELHYVEHLREDGIDVDVHPSVSTVFFENIYGVNPDDRTQNVLAIADAFEPERLQSIQAKIFHLGPLLDTDISIEVIKLLASKGLVSLDIQGFLRMVVNQKVMPWVWDDAENALPFIHTLKADENELAMLTCCKVVKDGMMQLADHGVQEIIITNGSKGSLIYGDGDFYTIPAFAPGAIVDATGCGDTYMAGYLYSKVKGNDIADCGRFAAAMASLKMEQYGPFTGDKNQIVKFLANQ